MSQKNDTEVRKILADADKLIEKNALNEAREKYEQAAKLDPANIYANFKAGMTYLESIQKHQSVNYFLKVKDLDPDYRFDIDYLIGRGYHYGYEFDKAIQYYQDYKDKLLSDSNYSGEDKVSLEVVEKRIEECINGKEMVNNPKNYKITNMGPKINSPMKDYAPVHNKDEDILIFTSRREEGNQNDKLADDNEPYEDIYIARKADDGWHKARNIGSVVNTPYHDSNLAISADGKRLFIYKDLNNGDIFESDEISDGEWSKPYPLRDINTHYAEKSISMSPDGNYIYFSSDRPGGIGRFDIYRSERKANGWAKPVNLGPEINTKYDEDSPFIDYDGKTLYFSSKGWKGMGGFDVFKSVYTGNKWSKPENLGYPINTPDEDIHFVSSQDGSKAYYASVREDSYGYSDIYLITSLEGEFSETEPEVEPQPVTLNVTTVDEEGKNVSANVEISNSGNQTSIQAIEKAPGSYSFVLLNQDNKFYTIKAEKPDYVTQVIEIEIPAATAEEKQINREITLRKSTPVKPVEKNYALRNIYFYFDKVDWREEYNNRLKEVRDYLKSNPDVNILIEGHTDNIGSEEYNMELSLERAIEVKEYLVGEGINESRISVRGKGATEPLVSNDDEEEGREFNRRVVFYIE